MEMDSDIPNIYFSVFLPFPSLMVFSSFGMLARDPIRTVPAAGACG